MPLPAKPRIEVCACTFSAGGRVVSGTGAGIATRLGRLQRLPLGLVRMPRLLLPDPATDLSLAKAGAKVALPPILPLAVLRDSAAGLPVPTGVP